MRLWYHTVEQLRRFFRGDYMSKIGLICIMLSIVFLGTACSAPPANETITPTYLQKSHDSSIPFNNGYCIIHESQIQTFTPAGDFQSVLFESDEKFLDLAGNGQGFLAVATNGLVVYSVNGTDVLSKQIQQGIDFISVVAKENGYWIGCSDGNLFEIRFDQQNLLSQPVTTQAGQPIISLSYGNGLLIGLTEQGSILSVDSTGLQQIRTINDFYDGTFALTDVVFSGKAHWILAQDVTNKFMNVFISVDGKVWNRRIINYLEGAMHQFNPPLIGNSIAWDGQQALVACNGGRLIALPDCAQCNTMKTYSCDDLLSVASDQTSVFVFGNNQFAAVHQTDASAAENIDLAMANQHIMNGAVLIDVRGTQDFEQDSIPNSVNIPFGELKQRLPKEYANREQCMIFTCAVGVRSAKAVQIAKELGYTNVYSIGAYTNWNK